MWSPRGYTRRKRAGQRLNLTPAPDLVPPTKGKAPPGLKGKGKAHGLPKIAEKVERSRRGASGSGPPSTQLRVTGEKSLQENSTEETEDGKIAPLSESVTDELQVDSSSSNSEPVSGRSLQHDISSSLLSCSITDLSTEYKSFEESSFPSPELFRGSDYLDWECPNLKEHMQCKNSTLLDTSKAVAIEQVPQFSNLSAILGTSSEDYHKCHRKTVMTLADQNISSKPKCTSNSGSGRVSRFSVSLDSSLRVYKEDSGLQREVNSKAIGDPGAFGQQEEEAAVAGAGMSRKSKVVLGLLVLLTVAKANSSSPDKKSRGVFTSTPSSETADFVIDLSSVQKASFEELFPYVSNYVNSNEIIAVSSLQENSSNEFPTNTSEMCCIIRASPGTRQVKSKGVIVKKKKYSPPKDIPQEEDMKTLGDIHSSP
ncbi:PREDICTED: probable GPI-anchored adhesin-like protein PGA55 [Galeopterus variegatus]|uniref:Probable GPI-anchored adhesin-like protein PGA55 n=1 Tax=Galeopterus variegatus TaxID=482537 RepID=A0ABM0QPW1_GALVR|nr:PREDICTED: probable GPI-anchored adhesin-like protein PGA55 [Galeopterus variegatus]